MKNMVKFFRKNKIYQYSFIVMTLVLFVLVGIVCAASVPHTFDPNTIISSSEVNDNFDYLAERSWEISVNGNDIYYNKGNLGIGMTEPWAKLHVGENIGGGHRNWMNYGIIVGKDSDGGYFGVKDEGDNREDTIIAWGDDIEDNLRFIFSLSGGPENGREIMRLTATGNIGLGTTAPGAKIEILDDLHSLYQKSLKVYCPNIEIGEREIISFGKEDSNYNAAELTFYYDGNTSHNNRLSLGLYASPETVNIIGTGTVGIGTPNPTEKLEVCGGNIKVEVPWGIDTGVLISGYDNPYQHYDYIRLRTKDTIVNSEEPIEEEKYIFGGFMYDSPEPDDELIDPFIDDAFNIYTYHEKNIAFVSPATIITGKVGIGTTNPEYELEVEGAVIMEDSGTPSAEIGHAGIYSDAGELYVIDQNGNTTQVSPHDPETGEWIFYSKNIKTGRVVKVNMEKLIRKIEELTGEKFFEEWIEGQNK